MDKYFICLSIFINELTSSIIIRFKFENIMYTRKIKYQPLKDVIHILVKKKNFSLFFFFFLLLIELLAILCR